MKDKSGLLEGDYADGRRLAMFQDVRDVKAKQETLQGVIRKWLASLDKS
ncbi:MAG TPA: hypothetical protein VKG84_05570 [Candidatus Acidoferrales bacterium]|nr:hypothetical protein [Candidatus Acidoferrales bacterium]